MMGIARVRLELRTIKSAAFVGHWWTMAPQTLDLIFASVVQAGLWFDRHYALVGENRRGKVLQSDDDLRNTIANVTDATARVRLQASAESREAQWRFDFADGSLGCSLHIDLDSPSLDRKRFIHSAVQFVCHLRESLPGAYIGPVARLAIADLPFPRPRPPRFDAHFEPGCLVDFIDRDFHERDELRRPAAANALLAAPLPDGVKKESCGMLTSICWVQDLTDTDRIVRQLSVRERWLDRHISRPVQGGYNALGDHAVFPTFLTPTDSVTLYDAEQGVGYQALYVDSSNRVSDESLRECLRWLANRQLPDGNPLRELYLIAPDRDRAIELRQRVSHTAVSGVYYPSDDGSAWFNPNPPGLWLTEEGQ
jgi:hypothetical protein